MIWRVRRVVTGHDAEGRSIFVSDGLAPNVKEMRPTFPGLALTDLWETKGAPADNVAKGDAADRTIHLEPPKKPRRRNPHASAAQRRRKRRPPGWCGCIRWC